MGDFRKLNVWQEAKDLSVEIYKITDNGKFTKDFGLKDQLRRATTGLRYSK